LSTRDGGKEERGRKREKERKREYLARALRSREVGGDRAKGREKQRERERERELLPRRERDGALSHDRARCNARAAMHKQRRASRSAPAKVTRVMSRCPLCRTNSATRPKALSRVRSRRAGDGGAERRKPTERSSSRSPSREPGRSSLASRLPSPCWNPLLRSERERERERVACG